MSIVTVNDPNSISLQPVILSLRNADSAWNGVVRILDRGHKKKSTHKCTGTHYWHGRNMQTQKMSIRPSTYS